MFSVHKMLAGIATAADSIDSYVQLRAATCSYSDVAGDS